MAEANVVQKIEEVIEQTQELKENASVIDFKMVTFSLAEKDYGIDIMHVKEIAKAGRFTYVPNTLPFVLGVYNLRGEIIPILDLRIFFNIEVPERTDDKLESLLILSIDEHTFGLVVDKIDKVVGVQKSTIQPPHPLFGDINIKYISGVVESGKNLYVLLDAVRIFSGESMTTEERLAANHKAEQHKAPVSAPVSPVKAEQPKKAEPKAEVNVDLKFIAESLKSYKNFHVTSINEAWVKRRYEEWLKEKGQSATQLQNQKDAEEFLKPFWSRHSDQWWSKEYAEGVSRLLPDNTAKQIVVWNPGCGKGIESYCLACILQSRYPEAKIRVYAQDVDLLTISNAGMLSVPNDVAGGWLAPYLTKKANGEYTFNQSIKDCIMFEYHDCRNTNVVPVADLIVARDLLSCLDDGVQKKVINDFIEFMKGNAIAIVGENETLPASYGFGEKSAGSILAYVKD